MSRHLPSLCFFLALISAFFGAGWQPGAAEDDAREQSEEECVELFRQIRDTFEAEKNAPLEDRIPRVADFVKAPCSETVEYLAGLYSSEENVGFHMAVTGVLANFGTLEAMKKILGDGVKAHAALPKSQPTDKDSKAALRRIVTFNLMPVAEAIDQRHDTETEEWILAKGLSPKLREYEDVWVRVIGAIARFRTPKRAETLTKELLQARDPAVQVAILEGLEGTSNRKLDRLVAGKLVRSPNVDVQVGALAYLAAADAEKYTKQFIRALKNPFWQVRVVSLNLLARHKDKNIVKHAIKLLDDSEPKVQTAAVRTLLHNANGDVLPELISRIDKTEGRVQEDIADALSRLTGKDYGPASVQWESWWAQNKKNASKFVALTPEEFSKLKEETLNEKTRLVRYYGLRLISDRVAFIIDCSESMKELYVPKEDRPEAKKKKKGQTKLKRDRKPEKEKPAANPDEKTKMEVAREELKNVLSGVPKDKRMNIIRFESVVADWIRDALGKQTTKLEPLADKIRPLAIEFIDQAVPQGQTYMLAALKAAFAYEDLETLYLLSDGAPTPESGSMEEILRSVKRWNRLRNVKINTIGFHLRPKEKDFLRRLADENFGVFVDH